jgi:sporadic carbohydrate cluster protein (TIGR04323 family)
MIAKGYIFSRSFMGERVPQSVQNLVLRNYCINNNIEFELSSTEYSMENSYYVLNKLTEEKKYKNIVFYSLFQLPRDNEKRLKIIKRLIKKRKKLFFAIENIEVKKNSDIKKIENIWYIKKISKKCLSTEELKI